MAKVEHPSKFELHQVFKNARDQSDWTREYASYHDLETAKKAAKVELKGFRWVIFETKLVASSEDK